jgi:MFS transporter, ACS family, D-galactonate transporter
MSAMRPKAWTVTALLFLFMAINFADKAVIGLAALPMMHDLGLTPVQWGTVGSSFFYVFPLSSLGVGFVVNRIASYWALAAMGVIWALTQFPMVGAASFATLIACRIALGAGEGPAFPVAVHAAYKWFPDERRALPTSVIAIGSAVGVFTAAPILVLVITHAGWHAAFFLLGVVGLIWTAAWLLWGGEGPIAEASPSATGARIPYRTIFTSRTVLGVLVAGFGVYWSLALLVSWLPAFLQQGLGYSVAASTALITLVWGAVAIGMPLIGWLSERARRAGGTSRNTRALPTGLLILAAGSAIVAALYLAPGMPQMALLVLGYSVGGVIFTLGPAMIGEIVPAAQRGAVFGIITALHTLAGMIAPAATGAIIAAGATLHDGYVTGFRLAGMIAAAGGLAALVLMRPEADLRRFGVSGGPASLPR